MLSEDRHTPRSPPRIRGRGKRNSNWQLQAVLPHALERDGVELAHFAHECHPEIHVVVTSGSPLNYGATFMPKPLLLLDVLNEAERSRH